MFPPEQPYSTKTPKTMVMQSSSMTLFNSCANISDDYKSVAFQRNFATWNFATWYRQVQYATKEEWRDSYRKMNRLGQSGSNA